MGKGRSYNGVSVSRSQSQGKRNIREEVMMAGADMLRILQCH